MKCLYTLIFLAFWSQIYGQTFFTTDYIALAVPQHYDGDIYYMNLETLTQEVRPMSTIPNNSELLSSFPNLVSNVTVYQVEKDGGLTIGGIGISAKNEIYQVIYDFSQTQTLVSEEDGKPKSVLIGVGVRMVAKVKTRKAGINLTNPFSLVANSKNISGSLEVRVIGLASSKINDLIPTTTDLSPASISVALQSIATIKTQMYGEETIVTPQYIAFNMGDEALKRNNLEINKLNTFEPEEESTSRKGN